MLVHGEDLARTRKTIGQHAQRSVRGRRPCLRHGNDFARHGCSRVVVIGNEAAPADCRADDGAAGTAEPLLCTDAAPGALSTLPVLPGVTDPPPPVPVLSGSGRVILFRSKIPWAAGTPWAGPGAIGGKVGLS